MTERRTGAIFFTDAKKPLEVVQHFEGVAMVSPLPYGGELGI